MSSFVAWNITSADLNYNLKFLSLRGEIKDIQIIQTYPDTAFVSSRFVLLSKN